MDTALKLRIDCDKEKVLGPDEIMNLLSSSQLVNELTSTFEKKPLFAVWRMIALAEIPYSQRLVYTDQVIEYIQEFLATPYGFSLTGKENDMLPCYNAMLLEAFSKMGYEQAEAVQGALKWIKEYQIFERNAPTSWTGKGIQKYGGCMKATPCFIGMAKTVKALIYYSKAVNHSDHEVASLIEKGMDYILKHELYKRISDGEPITKHILDIAFPASYQLNILELIEMAYLTGHIKDSACNSAVQYVKQKRTKDGFWKTNYIYKADGYLSFDSRGKVGDWITYLLGRYLS
ncbi:MAG: hypothetical protein N2484_08765 [Clostridia bacterium]|nr:hypothetical protein [Clostridia bacterium]